jgi:hypothetical protein
LLATEEGRNQLMKEMLSNWVEDSGTRSDPDEAPQGRMTVTSSGRIGSEKVAVKGSPSHFSIEITWPSSPRKSQQ